MFVLTVEGLLLPVRTLSTTDLIVGLSGLTWETKQPEVASGSGWSGWELKMREDSPMHIVNIDGCL